MYKSIFILIFTTVLSFYLGLVIGSFIEPEEKKPIEDVRSSVEISGKPLTLDFVINNVVSVERIIPASISLVGIFL